MKNCLITTVLGILLLLTFSSISLSHLVVVERGQYITSRDSKYCYPKGARDLKHKEFYKTVAECGKPLYEKN